MRTILRVTFGRQESGKDVKQVTHGGNGFPLFVWDGDVKAVFDCHCDFDNCERIGAEVFLNFCAGHQLLAVDAQLFDEDVVNGLCVGFG